MSRICSPQMGTSAKTASPGRGYVRLMIMKCIRRNVATAGKNETSSESSVRPINSAVGDPVILNHVAEENRVEVSTDAHRPSSPTISRVR